ncbi:FMN phosphatase YigB (HAD superfamily) [Neorhizobium sp. 2083]|uniref:hydrolase n=1 Tax=Neorhizobium sp. 2083 TaxID=2817762 RepID=UPI002859FA07|nr:hydrolase [Neorhizobium sp. 2083]MDR6817511.1 FMN phosphatase YigB (HAD superfamily) [Neorhizobium sp. 2083]
MLQRSLEQLHKRLHPIRLISTDVFDTLLLRTGQSQRSRIIDGEKRFARFLRDTGSAVSPEDLIRTRLLAERMAYRAVSMSGRRGEVRLSDVIARQLTILGLSHSLLDRRMNIEIDVEKQALFANGELAMLLRRHRQAGIRVVAISDTGLSSDRVSELIDHFHGPGLLDKIYSSADLGASKRQGDLFSLVLEAENLDISDAMHIGDDWFADYHIPHEIGLKAIHIPKNRLKRFVSRADGAVSEGVRQVRRGLVPRRFVPKTADQIGFGEQIFGPIVAELCLLLWLYGQQASSSGDAVMLFCARGGLGVREAFERLQSALRLPLPLKRENILISRLVAARTAAGARNPAVLDELAREFHGASFATVAHSLGSNPYELPAEWQQTFDASRFFAMLDTPAGQPVDRDIRVQNEYFKTHLDQIAGNAERLILCDTGLYGSTQRLLAVGLPERRFETVQFARCNYKGLSEDHFQQVAGLVVENRFYNPFKTRTVVLRYWHIIESLFEPAIPSVRTLAMRPDGTIIGNSGDVRFGSLDPAGYNPLLTGALRYIDNLSSGAEILRDAEGAWLRLKQAIINPSKSDMIALGVAPRSVDFGRSELVATVAPAVRAGMTTKIRAVKCQLWREGAIAQEFPRLKPALLRALEVAHVVRGFSAGLR